MSEQEHDPAEDPDVEAHGMKEVMSAGAAALIAAGAAGGVHVRIESSPAEAGAAAGEVESAGEAPAPNPEG